MEALKYASLFILTISMMVCSCTKVKSKNREGNYKSYHKNGALWRDENFKNDTLHGKRLTYYENGQLRTKTTFKMGLAIDSFIVYHANGRLMLQRFLDKKGLRQGKELSFFDNGKISQEEFYVDDDEDGISKFYHKNGNLKSSTMFKKGEKNGLSKWFNVDGKLIKEAYYKDDVVIKK